MANKFLITGGKPLYGTIDIRGSKNAALPIIAATLLTREKCTIANIPRVDDVFQILDMLSLMGSHISWTGERCVEITNKDINPKRLDSNAVKKMRASVLLVGPLLARFGRVEKMRYPGGCSIGARPIETHLAAFEDLGARVVRGRSFFSINMPKLPDWPRSVVLNEFSVTATENVLMFLSAFPKNCAIKIAAAEPHVRDLAKFLSKMGAGIRGGGEHSIEVKGKTPLSGAAHKVAADYIEAGTFIIAALAVGGKVKIRNAPASDLDFVIKKLVSSGADINVSRGRNTIEVAAKLPGRGADGKRIVMKGVQCLPHPGIPTDLQPAFAVLATQTRGETLIHEPLYENRLGCIKELVKMNAKARIYDPHRAGVRGPGKLSGASVTSRDLRAGAALVIAGLAARGETTVSNIEHIERGYEDFSERLGALGANIQKI